MNKTFSLPRGTADILPTEIPIWRKLETKANQVLTLYNYREIRTPIFEETELFARSIGQTSDIVQKQMLNLAAQDLNNGPNILSRLSLRPENTASIIRSYIENNFDKKENLTKLFYLGPMFRGERPQKGRLRQFHQIGVEAIGPDTCSPYLDAEIISLCVVLLNSFGLDHFELKINTLGTPNDKSKLLVLLKESLKPEKDKLCEDCQRRFEKNILRVLDCKNKDCKKIVYNIRYDDSWLSEESKNFYAELKTALRQLNINFREEKNLVRGLDYYTHTVFEISHPGLGSQDALGAGGRYNNLCQDLGGPQVDAIGFALGIERVILALSDKSKESGYTQLDVFIVTCDNLSFQWAWSILNDLRQNGLACDIQYKNSSIKSQMRTANKLNARFVIMIGEKERINESIILKNMETGAQQEIGLGMKDYSRLVNIILERGK